MNEILQKRIEEAAAAIAPFNRMSQKRDYFVKGADFSLQNQWISVDEALPKVNELVFGCVNDEGIPQAVGMAYYDEYGGWHYSDEEEISLITHWMPIPEMKGGEE